jgi:hypothetical protein
MQSIVCRESPVADAAALIQDQMPIKDTAMPQRHAARGAGRFRWLRDQLEQLLARGNEVLLEQLAEPVQVA